MDDQEHPVSPVRTDPSIQIAFRGAGVEEEARSLCGVLESCGIKVETSPTRAEDRASLGTPEIILTILATAAIKAVAETALQQLEEYLRERTRRQKRQLNVQIVIRNHGKRRSQRFLLSLQQATEETVIAFSKNVREAIEKL